MLAPQKLVQSCGFPPVKVLFQSTLTAPPEQWECFCWCQKKAICCMFQDSSKSQVGYFRRSRTHTWKAKTRGGVNDTRQPSPSTWTCYKQAPNYMRWLKNFNFNFNKHKNVEFIIPQAVAYRAVWCTGSNFVPGAVPANLENTTSAPVAVH